MKRLLTVSILFVLTCPACLKTRAELRGDEEPQSRPLAQQTRNQQVQQQQMPTAVKAPSPRQEDYDEQMRALNGRIEVLESQLQQMNSGDKDQAARDRQSLNDRLLAYEDAIKKLEAEVAALKEEMKAAPAKTAAAEPVKANTSIKNPGAAIYEEGQGHFNGKRWKEAIVSFSKYRDQNSKGKLYADSTYKIGVCFQELGMKDEARPFFEEVVTKYPGSKEAQKSSFRLKTMK